MSDDRPSGTDIMSSDDSRRNGAQEEQIPIDELHRLLADTRRRHLLSHLVTCSESPVPLEDLVDDVVEHEHSDPGPATHRVRVRTDLHHVHLPMLTDAGVIDYDPTAESVRYTSTDRLESLLSTSNAIDEEPGDSLFSP